MDTFNEIHMKGFFFLSGFFCSNNVQCYDRYSCIELRRNAVGLDRFCTCGNKWKWPVESEREKVVQEQ